MKKPREDPRASRGNKTKKHKELHITGYIKLGYIHVDLSEVLKKGTEK